MRDNALHFERGARLRTVDGKEIGAVDRIVFNSHGEKVTHVVVRKGVFLTHDRVIPVGALEPADDGLVISPATDPDSFPTFEQSDYVLDSHDDFYVANPGIAIGAYGPIGSPHSDLKRHRERNIPDDSIALHANSDVIASDGEKVGRVKEVIADAGDDRAIQLVVATGLGGRTQRAIPANLVISIAEGEVHLSLGVEEFERYAPIE